MSDNPHIIKAQTYLIGLEDKTEAYRFQTAISNLQHTRINSVLDKILDTFDDSNTVFQFDTIELDLGVIQKSNFENGIVYGIEETLSNYLNHVISKNGTLREGQKITYGNRALDDLEHYLEKGHFNWTSNNSETPSGLLHSILNEDENALLSLLKRIAKKENVRKRIAYNFNDKDLEAIVKLTARSHSDYIIEHKRNIVRTQRKDKLVTTPESSFNKVVWEIILAYLFAEGRSYFGKKSYLQYLIVKLAKRYNTSYAELLFSLSEGVKVTGNIQGEGKEFRKIIQELSLQSQSSATNIDSNSIDRDSGLSRWLKHVDYYLDHGVFTSEFGSYSRLELNKQLKTFLKTKNKIVLAKFDTWLSQEHQRKKLGNILLPEIQNEMVSLSNLHLIKAGLSFVNSLLEHQNPTFKDQRLLKLLMDAKASLILDVSVARNYSEETLMRQILLNMFKIPNANEQLVFKFLISARDQVSVSYQKHIDAFLMNFYQNMGHLALEEISLKVKNYFSVQPREKWGPWFESQLLEWQRVTGLSKTTLIQHIKTFVKRDSIYSETSLYGRLKEAIDSFNFEKQRFNEIDSGKQSDIDSRMKSLVFHILEYSQIPWWAPSYSFARFESDLIRMLKFDSEIIKIRDILRNKSARLVFMSQLSVQTEIALLKALGETTDASFYPAIHEITRWLRRSCVSSGIVSREKYSILTIEILKLLVRRESAQIHSELVAVLKRWICQTAILNYQSTSEELLRSLKIMLKSIKHNSAKNELQEWIDNISEVTSDNIKPQSTSKTLNEFLASFSIAMPKVQTKNRSLVELIGMLSQRGIAFNSLLMKGDFRSALVAELSHKEIWKVIGTQLTEHQQSFYLMVTTYLQSLQTYLSTKEYKLINRSISTTLLLKLSAGGVDHWVLKDWVEFVNEIMLREFGITKTDRIIFRVQNGKTANSEAIRAFVVKQLQINQSEKSLMHVVKKDNDEEEREYRKLGEESKHQLMNPVFLQNAGLIILSPYLGMLFEKCALMENGTFINDESKAKAIQLLVYAATAEADLYEHELIIQKVLCGIPISSPVDTSVEIDEANKAIVDDMLYAVTQQWNGLENTTVDSLRASFLQRDGKLEELEETFYLKVEQKAFDMLLDRIPWNITKIKLSWMPKILEVEWR